MSQSIAFYTHATITDDVIIARVAHFNRMLAEELPDDPPFLAEDTVKRLRNLPPTARSHYWVLTHDGRIAAEAYLGWAELDSNRAAAGISVSVEPELRRCGIGSQLLTLAAEHARKAGRSRLFAGSSDRVPAGEAFLERFGFAKGLEAHINQLELARLDMAMLARWVAAGSERAGGYAIELWDGPVPEQRLVAFAELSNVMNGEPKGSLEVEDTNVTPQMIRDGEACIFANGSRRLIACARHVPSGELVGFTELSWNPKRASIIWQHGTGVVDSHRNKGLGRWLKAANMEAMLGQNSSAKVVRTGNADSNAPMLAINRQMGFEPFIAEAEWQGQAETVLERLIPADAAKAA